MKKNHPTTADLLQKIQANKVELKISKNAYKEEIKSQLTSPLALASAVLAGIILSKFIWTKKIPKKPVAPPPSRQETKPALLEYQSIAASLITLLLPRLLVSFYDKINN